MSDIIDRAAEREAEFREAALARAVQTSEYAGESNYECDDCGGEIPEARRRAVPGCTRCVFCQEYFEHGYP